MELLKTRDSEKTAILRTDLEDAGAKTIQNELANVTCKTIPVNEIKKSWKDYFTSMIDRIKQTEGIDLPKNDPTKFYELLKTISPDDVNINSVYYEVVLKGYTDWIKDSIYFNYNCSCSSSNNIFSLGTITKDTNSMMMAGGILAVGGIIGYFIGKK